MKAFRTKYLQTAGIYAFALLFLSTGVARAWMRTSYSDPEVVQRAELIVVAHLKEGSLVYVPHQSHNGIGAGWEYHGVLIIAEVLKGESTDKQIPVTIHFGLTPITGGYLKTDHMMMNVRFGRPDYPKDVIELFDTGNSAISMSPISGDIRNNQLWFLRFQSPGHGGCGDEDSTDSLGIWDPEDIQPLELQPYFQAFLTDQPEQKLREYAFGDSNLAAHAKVYLQHLRMEDILRETDVNSRAQMLLPYALFTDQKDEGAVQREALQKLGQGCGQAGAAALVPVFNDLKYEAMQAQIMFVWSDTKYYDAIPLLSKVIENENAFWVKQTPAELALWEDESSTNSPNKTQIVSRRRLEGAIYVFGGLCDPSTKPLIEQTKQLWNDLYPTVARTDIVQVCDMALLNISRNTETK